MVSRAPAVSDAMRPHPRPSPTAIGQWSSPWISPSATALGTADQREGGATRCRPRSQSRRTTAAKFVLWKAAIDVSTLDSRLGSSVGYIRYEKHRAGDHGIETLQHEDPEHLGGLKRTQLLTVSTIVARTALVRKGPTCPAT